MNRFVSNFTNKLDSKGRVSIPASFRAVLARDGFEGLYVHPALDAPALDAGGNVLLNEIDAFLSTLSPYSDERDQLSTALFGTSEILKVDPEGRVILTEYGKSACRDRRRGDVRRTRSQVPDLGARTLPCALWRRRARRSET